MGGGAPSYYPSYEPPIDAEDGSESVLINAWLGRALTVSPPHRDPYYNFYTQIVGSKIVWIAPPEPEVVEAMNIGESITSSVEVFTKSQQSLAFERNVRPWAMFAILQPGDVLIMPPGWFHAFKALTKSFSVSMWF
ncbi:Clavaminate synthase-like protein [Meira miltonrushii]|uniref:Clavaminate synthase-like protein n=1 Tax=Meira miltonrushii TaxID=1280837 RepID=A0A316VLY5_9BASI|nr:Clavaminate synthase-like protein [Meira miltonrushii]PWN36575.1 Clavaminate synthase-like protein [Meira miltonrushii]